MYYREKLLAHSDLATVCALTELCMLAVIPTYSLPKLEGYPADLTGLQQVHGNTSENVILV